MPTITEVLQSTMDLVNLFDGREDEMRDWWAGTADGGPNGDGLYPMTNSAGVTTFFPSIPKIVSQIEKGVDGLDGGVRFNFDGIRTDSAPTAGRLRMNGLTAALTTQLYISTSEVSGGGVGAWIDAIPPGGKLVLRQGSDSFAIFTVSGAIVTATGYRKVPVTYIAHGGSFLDGQDLVVGESQTGLPGADGNTIRFGTGFPAAGLGTDGDFYIDTNVKELYGPKTSGAWGTGTSMVGPKGDKGDQGDQGVPGPESWAQVVSWATNTGYQAVSPTSVVTQDGSTYVCQISHLSGTFSTDLAAGRWKLVARKGIDGNGTGTLNPAATVTPGNVAVWVDETTLADGGAPGAANGFATLDANGKVPASQLDQATVGGLNYQGTWNANTNTPPIPAPGAANKGHYYKVSVAGATVINGVSEWAVGDWILSNGSAWEKIDNTDQVQSVAGKTGAVTLVKGDVGLGNVDNTSDANKPVSTAQQAALDLKVSIASKATTSLAEEGANDDVWMTPLKTAQAIAAQSSANAPQGFSVYAVGTGAPQEIAIPVDASLDDLLVFENGVEQDKLGLTKPTATSIQGTFLADAKIRVMLSAGYRGQSFKVDVYGPLAARDAYLPESYGFVYGVNDDPRLPLYIRNATESWDGPFYMQGPQGVPGNDGADGVNGLSPWEKKTANFTAVDKGRYRLAGGITVTLPTPGDGKEVWFVGNFKAANTVIARNGATIAGVGEDLTLNENNISPKLVCFDNNWDVAR